MSRDISSYVAVDDSVIPNPSQALFINIVRVQVCTSMRVKAIKPQYFILMERNKVKCG